MVPSISTAADSLLFSSNAGPGNATVTHGNVSLVHGTCTYFALLGGGSFGICTGLADPPDDTPFHAPQYFCTSGSTASGVTSPATITVVNCGRYQRSKNSFEYAYSFGMFSMSLMNPIVVCL